MADQTLTFLGWTRERITDLVTGTSGGRAVAAASVTLSSTNASGDVVGTHTGTLDFALAGPADVIGLDPRAITRRYPSPGASDHESDRCPHVEFADASLPWRYTPGPKPAAGTGSIHPWLVLVVGSEDSELTLTSDQVTLSPGVQALHPVGTATSANRWAHVQVDAAGHRIGRVLSGRSLAPSTDYLAVLVPAYRADGQPSWNGTAAVTVAVYDHWRFRTAVPAGSFEDLAAALQPGDAPADTGRAPLTYPRLPGVAGVEVRGALAPVGSADADLPADVATDLAGLRTPATDEVGRPIVGLPDYGDAWPSPPADATWRSTLNDDPRHRGVAGLGLEIGIERQDELVDAAVQQAGALAEARQKINHLVLGLVASTALWESRLPADPHEQLWLMGPALGRVATQSGTLRALSTAPDRALPAGVWSSAARRVLRSGPSRVAATAADTVAARPTLAAANRVPPAPQASVDGVTLVNSFDVMLTATLQHGAPPATALQDLSAEATALAAQAPVKLRTASQNLATMLRKAAQTGQAAPYAEALVLLVSAFAARNAAQLTDLAGVLSDLNLRFGNQPPPVKEALSPLIGLGATEPPPEPPCTPVDLDALALGVAAAFDPTADTAAMRTRVVNQLGGLDPAQPLAPPEACVGIDRPVWRDVDDVFPEWLLPGVTTLDDDAVIALATNPAFVDALLVGLNTQLLGELRWRNIPVATGCTPLRSFWQRADPDGGGWIDDIAGVANWPASSDLGAVAHQTGTVTGADLVVAVRGRLFLRYPSTVVYLKAATSFDVDPDPAAPPVLPAFQGRIGADVSFFGFQGIDPASVGGYWLVFEEPPAGYRFANDASTASAPEQWAAESLAHPVRVLIRGDRLVPGGGS